MLKAEFDTLVPATGDFNRRDFVRKTVGSGFAAAVLPVAAQTVRTPSDGLLAGEVFIPVGKFRIPAYRAVPAGKTKASRSGYRQAAAVDGWQRALAWLKANGVA